MSADWAVVFAGIVLGLLAALGVGVFIVGLVTLLADAVCR